MNFIFISPQFPRTYWNWCDRLHKNGVNVLGIGDTPYDAIAPELKRCLTEYYFLPSLEDYGQVFRAVAFFSYKYGKIDWIESNNEHWLEQDARLRTDFHVTTGPQYDEIRQLQSKADMKRFYEFGHIPTATQIQVGSEQGARAFIREVGYPVFVKPERGVGAQGSARIDNDEELERFFAREPDVPYVMEEYLTGDLVSYDAIFDSHCDPLFENMEEFPPSMAEVAQKKLDMVYCCRPRMDPELRRLGRAAAKSFAIRSRFAHMEFFRLNKDREGLARKGDYVGLEVNVRPPGGRTPDLMSIAHSVDVYQIWADMVSADRRVVPRSGEPYYAVYVGRRDIHDYAHGREDIMAKFGDALRLQGRMPDSLADDMGNDYYVARTKTDRVRKAFVKYVCEKKPDKDAEQDGLQPGPASLNRKDLPCR